MKRETALQNDLPEALEALLSREWDPAFWTPPLIGKASAWWAHVPFAFWIMTAVKPRLFVELGTHNGVSYAAFCESVVRSDLGTRCFAVDTWRGDEHAGAYGDQVYNDLRSFHDLHYAAFSELMRCTFDEAQSHFADGSIDLLHIDGFHTYEAVSHDFETWLPKLSDRAVVLLHDTNVHEREFGVYRFVQELRQRFPVFEFLHGYGLGIVAVGSNPPEVVRRLCAPSGETEFALVRQRFAQLGMRWMTATREKLGAEAFGPRLAEALRQAQQDQASQAAERQAALNVIEAENQALRRIADRSSEATLALRQSVEEARARSAAAEKYKSAFEIAQTEVADYRQRMEGLLSRYVAAIDDPAMSMKSKLRRRLRMIAARLRIGAVRSGELQGIEVVRRSIYFDRVWYLETYPDVAATGVDPVEHYVRFGGSEGRNPSSFFSSSGYLESNPDIRTAGLNPLLHFLRHGQHEGRKGGVVSVAPRRYPAGLVLPHQLGVLFVSGEAETPGHLYRVERYMEAARANGTHADWVRHDEVREQLTDLGQYAVVVIWRAPWSPVISSLIQSAKAASCRVVFDVDDLMIDPNLADIKVIDGIRSQDIPVEAVRQHYERVRQTMLAADVCFTTTQELAFHMRWAGKTTHILCNGFDRAAHDLSRHAVRAWKRERTDDLIRIGYASGSRTHQRDFALVVGAVAKVLDENRRCRLVLFKSSSGMPTLDVEEFPELQAVQSQVEWRPLRPLSELPNEMARFDINLAPLEFGNVFCEAKSELKFFEAALVDVPTIASPTGPFRRAIDHGRTGFLASSADDWYHYLSELLHLPERRAEVAHAAYHSVLGRFGPLQRAATWGRVFDQVIGGPQAARGFALEAHLSSRASKAPRVFPSDVVFEQDKLGKAAVTVVIPLYNYEQYIVEALESVKQQTLATLDLVVVDGASTDKSLAVALAWVKKNAARFNRAVVLQNRANYGLGFCRNSGFDAADTAYVLPLDADNRLRPACCESLLATIEAKATAYVYPTIQHFGASDALIGAAPYEPQRFVAGNYVDAMALVSKEAWAAVGGYDHVRHGWEDYDFWCRIAESGLGGFWKDEILAEYRVHPNSMMTVQTVVPENYQHLHRNFKLRHPWVSLVDEQRFRRPPVANRTLSGGSRSRLDWLLPILRSPDGQKLAKDGAGDLLVSLDGLARWPVVNGCPVLARGIAEPEIKPQEQISNALPERAIKLIEETDGLVLNLSAGGSARRFDHVIEVEYSIFRHTDVVADAHELPFDDDTFEAVVVMNAFEHYKEPERVVAELRRVMKPGARLLLQTAFMQPLHERPWHFYNCTRHGLEHWFKDFELELVHVSPNFSPNHTFGWLASEAEAAIRAEISSEACDAFRNASLGDWVELWRDPSKRDTPLWTNFDRLSQTTQEVMSAGFELAGRKPLDRPDLQK